MPNLKDIRNRIGTVKNTKKITSAMKLVAAAKLRRAQEAVQAARPYATKMTALIDDLSSRVPEDAHPLLVAPEKEENVLVILVTSDRGLCGGFNSNLIRSVARFVREKRELTDTIRMITVGRKGNQFFKRSTIDIESDYPGLSADVTFEGAKEVAQQAMAMFTNGEVDAVYLAFNEFISAIAVEQHIEQILPLTREDADPAQGGSEIEYIYEPSEAELLGTLLPNSVEIRVFQALLESAAGEQGQRMTAMDNATSNASDMIDDLTLTYNRARQAYITKELVEIVSGAESLKG